MDVDDGDPNRAGAPAFDPDHVAHSTDASSPAIDMLGDVTKPTGNTRVKVIPVSAISPATAHRQSRSSTTRITTPEATATLDDAKFRRSSRVQPSLSVNTSERVVSYRQRSFIHRRMDVWDSERDLQSSPSRKLGAGSISALPIPVQAGFRRKVLLIFDLQLLLLTGVISLLTYETHLDSLMHQIFYSEWILLIALGAMILSLFGLYQVHSRFPWNWIAMIVFTVVFSVLIAGAQVVLKTHVGVFCCGFTFLAMCAMTVLCGVRRTKDGQSVFLSALVAGFVSYALVAIGCGIVVGVFHASLLTNRILAYALVLEFALIMWFSYDAITIFRLITPDEYMHGVIYFYTDVLVLTMISVAAIALVLLCTACGGAGGGGAGFGYINPTGCSSGGCCGCCADGGPEDGMEGDGEGDDDPAQAQRNEEMDRG